MILWFWGFRGRRTFLGSLNSNPTSNFWIRHTYPTRIIPTFTTNPIMCIFTYFILWMSDLNSATPKPKILKNMSYYHIILSLSKKVERVSYIFVVKVSISRYIRLRLKSRCQIWIHRVRFTYKVYFLMKIF